MKRKINRGSFEERYEKSKTALEISKELFMMTGNINYYNLYKAIENPEDKKDF